ncbi:MAG: rhodanese-like domain-containing protein [Proteobacteria bacterium]|nr:rhodanese-like domain-containing protein [Pseudomonadota bacterium]
MSQILHRLPEFLGHHPFLALAFVGIVAAIIGNEIARRFRGYRELTPAALTLLVNREEPLLVDLSSDADFEKSHIAGARHVAMSQFDPENKDLAKARDLPVALVCKTGATSAQAAARLVKAGFGKVYVLGGGMTAWREAALPTAKGRK